MRKRSALASAGAATVVMLVAGVPAAAQSARGPLDLGPYGRPSSPRAELEAPRFESQIDVLGKMPPDYQETMTVFWRQWDLSTGSIYGKGINFQNQGCPTCVNILPLVEKVIQKVKGQ